MLHRTDDDDALFRNSENVSEANDAAYKVGCGKVVLIKLGWRMPSLKLSDEKLKLYTDIQNKTTLPIEFLNRQCENIQMNSC